MAKLDIRKKLSDRKGKIPPAFPYACLKAFGAVPNCKRMKLEIVDNVGVKTIPDNFLVLSNHTSRCDWQYIGLAFSGHRLNYMASYIEFNRSHMHFVFDLLKVIPKRNFINDIHPILEVMQIIKQGGNVILFPEGKSSISGSNQPIMPGTAQMVRQLKVPVYSTTIRGGYMSNTQWDIYDRPGKVVIEVNRLFTVEETQTLPLDEIERRINTAIYNDDFEWNRTARVKYEGNDRIANRLEEHLYLCPKCGRELTMHGEGNVFKCTACGNGATIDEYYDLHPLNEDCLIPKTLRVWYELQRRKCYRDIKNDPDFRIEEKVTLGALPNDHYVDKTVTSEPVGEGIITLDRNEFTYKGTKNGEPFELHQKTVNMLSVVLETDSSYFGAFFDNREYYEFHPEHKLVPKWLLSVEECHRLAGGKWQNNLPEQQWIYEDDKPTDRENYYL
ncbi:MAG: 1-acyl-sn-glycerol-3-phosphate acyltransferase [Clostridiales bacterium]|nr:1-acyl-sn-glycerol-3-phosphate acyltransferase [Clostridiales bacterium]